MIASSIIPCNVEKYTLQFTELYNMTCMYCRVEDKLSVCIKTKTPSCIPNKKLRLLICI